MNRGELFRKYSVPGDRLNRADSASFGYAGNIMVRLDLRDGVITGKLITLFYEKEIPFRGLDRLVLLIDTFCRESAGYQLRYERRFM